MTYMNYKILNNRCSYQKIPEQSEKKKTEMKVKLNILKIEYI